MLKKIMFAVLAALFLAGCAQVETAETVADVLEEPVLAAPREIRLSLMNRLSASMESDSL